MRSRRLALTTLAALVAAFGVDARLHADAVDGRHHEASCEHAEPIAAPQQLGFVLEAPHDDDDCPPCLLHSSEIGQAVADGGIVEAGAAFAPPAPLTPSRELRLGHSKRGPPAA